MPRFAAKVELRFESASLETAGADLRRLAEAAESVGFEVTRGTVAPAASADEAGSGATGYGPPTGDEPS